MEKKTAPKNKEQKKNPRSLKNPTKHAMEKKKTQIPLFYQGFFLSYHSVSVHARSDVGPNLAGKVAAI
jgi:hypothetical protein